MISSDDMNTKLSIIELDVLKTLNSQEGDQRNSRDGASLGKNGAIALLRELRYVSTALQMKRRTKTNQTAVPSCHGRR